MTEICYIRSKGKTVNEEYSTVQTRVSGRYKGIGEARLDFALDRNETGLDLLHGFASVLRGDYFNGTNGTRNFGTKYRKLGRPGNGTYKNPILESNYPDNDVIRVGNTFYMMSSTDFLSPGMIILKSRDLVNWHFSNAIMPAPITFDRNFDIGHDFMRDKGTWAGSFGYDGRTYHAYWCHYIGGSKPGARFIIVHSKASSIEGPWSQPKEITWADGTSIDSTDPGVMWDMKNRKAWLAVGPGFLHAVKIFPMSWDGDKLLQNKNEGIVVTTTYPGESVKMYEFDGMYYVMNTYAHGPNTREQIISRASQIEGPWEGRVVLENGNGTDRCPSQGTLLKLDDGSWWFIHQLARGTAQERYDGRPQMLEPVIWKDGWPLIGVDTTGDGIGKVVWEHKKPINGFPVTAPATDDDFDSPILGLQWSWAFNPRMDRWSLTERPGFLRLKSCVSLPTKDQESIMELPNVVGQRLMGHHDNVMTAKFDFSGMVSGGEGGLEISSEKYNSIGVKKDDAGKMHLFFKSNVAPSQGTLVVGGPAVNQTGIWLQAKVEGGLATFYYSLDGSKFTQLGKQERLLFSGFTPNMVGFYTKNTVEKGYMDVDWFKYAYDGPKGRQ